jgi:hypothetical protein
LSDVNVVAYADDMYFIFESDTWEDGTKIVAEEIKKAILWLQKFGMAINASKTEAAYF